MPASPCPMPGVSTTTRSAPHAAHAASTSSRCAGIPPGAPPAPSERKYTCGGVDRVHPDPVAEQRAAAAPAGRVDRDDARSRSLSSRSRRNRRSSSSVSELLPDPPVPVMPRTGTCRAAPRGADRGEHPVVERALLDRGDRPREREAVAGEQGVGAVERGPRASSPAIAHISLAIPARPSRAPSSGEKIFATPRASSSAISFGMMTPPPPPKTRIDGPARAGRARRPGSAKNSMWPPWYELTATPWTSSSTAASTISATERLWPRWTTSHPSCCEQAADQVDRRVVAVEERRRGDEPEGRGRASLHRSEVTSRPPDGGVRAPGGAAAPWWRPPLSARSPSSRPSRSGGRPTWRSGSGAPRRGRRRAAACARRGTSRRAAGRSRPPRHPRPGSRGRRRGGTRRARRP